VNSRVRQHERLPRHRRSRSVGWKRRSGFTLVELLVAMTIFVILAALTVAGFRTTGTDRIGAASGTVRNALDGARSRAIRAGEPRGLRLIRDPNDPRIITSMVYIGQPDFDEGIGRIVFEGGIDRWVFRNESDHWPALAARDLLYEVSPNHPNPTRRHPRNRIEIPAGSGNWFVIDQYPRIDANGDPSARRVRLVGHYEPSIFGGGGLEPVPNGVTIRYRLELAPTPLPGSDPILLPAQTCIDLDGSAVPWRNNSGNYPEPNLDIMFGPDGTVIGGGAAEGLFVFRIASPGDVLLARGNLSNGDPLATTIANPPGSPVVVANPVDGHRAVALYPKTGAVLTSDINSPGSLDGSFNNQILPANVAYRFILRGRGTE
jgi:prepilin-type N-terminal cleavage/methylation domain-containing protein